MSRKSRDVYSNKLFGAGQGKAVAARHLVEQCFGGLYSAPLRAKEKATTRAGGSSLFSSLAGQAG